MIQREITSFDDVIMFEMQRTGKTLFTFNEIWQVCARASAHLKPIGLHTGLPFKYDPDKWRKAFARDMIAQIRLLEKMGLINIFTKDNGERIERITLTNDGRDFLSEIIFMNQQRMGDKP